jgi:putative phosphoserine phosphatase / 1-acylglycerol-3-phosphate O-acyltransferase
MAGDGELTADIDSGPSGPEIGAIFGLDGTILSGYSGMVLAADRLRRRQLGVGDVVRPARAGLEVGLGRGDFADVIGAGWRGVDDDELEELGERLFVQRLARRIFPEARALVAAHQRKGHTVVLASSATRYQAEPVARDLGIEHVLCTRLEVENGLVTGRVLEPRMWGEGKADTVQKFAAEHGVDLAWSYAYADGGEDVALLESVGKPRPTNPGRGLARTSRERGWPVRRFPGAERPRGGAVARTLAAYAGLYPVGLVSAAAGLLGRSVKPAVDTAQALYPELTLAIGGVEVRAVGEEHLWSHRPAVFVWNHVNMVDPTIVAKLVQRDYVSVGKAELGRIPVVGDLTRRLGVAVYVDRSNTAKAVTALEPVVEALKHGKSVLIAPEGTRTPGRLGAFKKGAFRIAMAGQVPIVPIVIRNAVDVQAGSGWIMRPGTVDVCVHAPISVADWTLDTLNDRIAEVRQLFIDTLAHWPSQEGTE